MSNAGPEPRSFPILALCVLFGFVVFVPHHLRVLPRWVPYLALAAALLPMLATMLSGGARAWQTIERRTALLLGTVVVASALSTLVTLIRLMLEGSRETDAVTLLTSSVVVWTENVVGFAFVYWRLDGGAVFGPAGDRLEAPDWLFPHMDDDSRGQRAQAPTFVDYLFLAFSTATAFSAADTVPLTHRAKLLMMLQASISMVTLAVVAARAINVLGS